MKSESDIASVARDATRRIEATGWRPRHDIDDMLQALLEDARAEVRQKCERVERRD